MMGSNYILPTKNSSSEVWIAFYQSLDKVFFKSESRQYFLRFWSQRGGEDAKGNTTSLRNYLKAEGIEIDTTIAGQLNDLGHGFVDNNVSFFKSIGLVVIIAVGIILLLIGLYVYVQVKQSGVVSDIKSIAQ